MAQASPGLAASPSPPPGTLAAPDGPTAPAALSTASLSALLDQVLPALAGKRIAVVGDFFLDEYFRLDPQLTELSIETGLDAYQVVRRDRAPGAAGTVVNNLCALGVGQVLAVGVCGEDGEGCELKRALERQGVDTTGLVVSSQIFTPTYLKPMLQEQPARELNRLDTKNRRPLPAPVVERVIAAFHAALPDVDAVIVADQVQERNCGVVSDELRSALAAAARQYPGKIFLADSRVRIGEFSDLLVKPNDHELAALFEVDPAADSSGEATAATAHDDLPELAAMGQELARRTGAPVFATCGARGMLVCRMVDVQHVPGIAITGPLDTVGAGDSATAGIVCALAAGVELASAAAIGNLVASITVQKLGTTGTASPAELQARAAAVGDALPPRPTPAEWKRRPTAGKRVEVVRRSAPTRIRAAIFDFDGTLSLIREGWQQIMIPYFVEEILAAAPGEDPAALDLVVREFVYRLTGKQTIYQMMQLAEEVRRRGAEPRTPLEYKQRYHDRLMERIGHRVEQLQSGQASPDQFLVPGAVQLLEALNSRGAKLHLASGTDLTYVRTEAQALGIVEFFGPRIYGALERVEAFSKKMVIETVLRESGLHGPDLVAFGDGYVEIENTCEAGGRAVGVASDEARPGELDGWKRNRLISAGAHLITPDLSEAAVILHQLTGE